MKETMQATSTGVKDTDERNEGIDSKGSYRDILFKVSNVLETVAYNLAGEVPTSEVAGLMLHSAGIDRIADHLPPNAGQGKPLDTKFP